jgi:hypothetical protein
MPLFGAQRGEFFKRLLVEDGGVRVRQHLNICPQPGK